MVKIKQDDLIGKRIYVCGKMSDIDDFNYPYFRKITQTLRAKNINTVCPTEIKSEPHWEWADFMKANLIQMLSCDFVYALAGHEGSRGATIEITLAKELGLIVLYEESTQFI